MNTRQGTARKRVLCLLVGVLSMFAASCGQTSAATGSGSAVATQTAAVEIATTDQSTGTAFLSGDEVHDIAVEFDEDAYAELLEAYAADGSKEWISATVTIDGTTYEDAGVRLKGNSSLFGLAGGNRQGPGGSADADSPESLPWLIRLDKYVEGQNHNGIADIVVRSNNSDTALNEAVALDLLEIAGLASQDSAYATFTVNDSDPVLRLVMEHPDEIWMDDAFSSSGSLYKAESTGDYSYRGEDPEAYDEVFDLEAGDDEDLSELIAFLDFINSADDASFSAELDEWLDTEAFATYLAAQELIANQDDIDGRGNNSYLFYSESTGQLTVVPWDHNLAFGGLGQGLDLPQGGPPQDLPGRTGVSADRQLRAGPGGGLEISNVLVERFLSDHVYLQMYEDALTELTALLFDSDVATDVLDSWAELLRTEAAQLVTAETVAAEAEVIASYFD